MPTILVEESQPKSDVRLRERTVQVTPGLSALRHRTHHLQQPAVELDSPGRLMHLRRLVGSHDQPLGCAAPDLGRGTSVLVADHRAVLGLRLHLLPLGRVALHLITVGGSSAHLASLWLRFLPAMISSLPQSELARQLSDLGGRVFYGLYGALVRDLDGRDVSGDLRVLLSQLSQRASRVVG
jgi:hypothetical protein